MPDTSRRTAALLLSVLALAAAACGASAQPLQERIDLLLRNGPQLDGGTVGISIVDAHTGVVLAARNEDAAMLPASNHKLLTTAAAIMTLGPGYVYETTLERSGGTLILRGSGDPGLGDPALLLRGDAGLTVEEMLGKLAGAALDNGRGPDEIVVDDRVFDREFVHDSWPRDQLNRWYCAEVAGVNLHTNVLTFFLEPSEAGAGGTPSAIHEPRAPWIEVINRASTVGRGRNTAWIARPSDDDVFRLYGDVHAGSSAAVDVTFHNPPRFAGRLLAKRIGERTGGTTPGVRLADFAEAVPSGRPVAIVRTSLADVLRRANTNSQNLYTEAILKTIGHEVTSEPGSWSNGASVVRMLLSERLGPEHATGTRIADGSGLSRGNRVRPETLALWLAEAWQDEAVRGPLLASMPRPGEGTLRSRFGDRVPRNEIRAKSGSIDGVRCLSGYVLSPRGDAVAFSVLINDLPAGRPLRNAKILHERVVAEIDAWLAEAEGIRGQLGG